MEERTDGPIETYSENTKHNDALGLRWTDRPKRLQHEYLAFFILSIYTLHIFSKSMRIEVSPPLVTLLILFLQEHGVDKTYEDWARKWFCY